MIPLRDCFWGQAVADSLTASQRSHNMSCIRSRGNRSTEGRLVQILAAFGLKGWRRHIALPGKPDFVFRSCRLAVFVDGCFWHGCPRCGRMPRTHAAYWKRKIHRNKARDKEVGRLLRQRGWKVLRLWEHSLRCPARVVFRLRTALKRNVKKEV